MSLLEQARADTVIITTGPFSELVEFIAQTGEVVTVRALHNKIGRKVDQGTGMIVNSKNASVVVHEDVLGPTGFPIRDSNQEVSMLGTLINVKDSSRIIKKYIVQEDIPDETTGLITLLLGDYSE